MIWSRLFGKDNESINNAVESFLSVIINPDMGIEELAKLYSSKLDEIILKEMSTNLSYVGGTFNIAYLSEKSFELSFELFFQDADKEWVKKESKSKPQPMNYLTEEASKELLNEKTISFEVEPPKVKKTIEKESVKKVRKMPSND